MAKRSNGEGSVYHRNDGKWVAAITLPPNLGGKKKYHYGKNRKDNAIDPVGRNTFYDDVCRINTAFTRDKVSDGEKRVNGFKGLEVKSNKWTIPKFKGGKNDERK